MTCALNQRKEKHISLFRVEDYEQILPSCLQHDLFSYVSIFAESVYTPAEALCCVPLLMELEESLGH